MKKALDEETRKLMGEKSTGEILLSYGIALMYAAVAAFAAVAGRALIDAVARKIVFQMTLEVNQVSGFLRLATIVGMALMVLVWIVSFLIVWHRVEHADSARAKLLIGARWGSGAAVLLIAFAVIQRIVAGYWPF